MKRLKWLLLIANGLLLWIFLANRQLVSALLVLLAISLFIPWSRNWMTRKLPLLANSKVLYCLWIALFFSSCGTIEPTSELNSLSICHQMQQGQCVAAQPAFFAKSPQLYLTGTAKHLSAGDELKVTLQKQTEGGQPQDMETLKVKPSIAKVEGNAQPVVLEVQPKQLPAGDYIAKIESSRRFTPITQNFSVWDAALNQPMLCSGSQRGKCEKDTSAFVRGQEKIYVSAIGDNIKEDMDVDWSLAYTSEVGKTKVLDNQTTQAVVDDTEVLLPIKPKALPVGSYELTLSSPQKRFESQKKTFTVWNSAEDAIARSDDRLLATSAKLGKLMLCDRSAKPLPKAEEIEEVVDPKTGKLKLRKPKKSYDRTFCTSDVKEFPASTKAFGFQLDLANVTTTIPIKVTWIHPMSGAAGQSSIDELAPDSGGLNYTFSGNGGFPPGNYGLIISLETQGSQPIYREFKVK
jgi:hypothetical protein